MREHSNGAATSERDCLWTRRGCPDRRWTPVFRFHRRRLGGQGLPGEFYVTGKSDEVIVTVLGSCVAACIRDPLLGIGGMNHFMLPQSHSGRWGSDAEPTRFGNFAMEKLINEVIKAGATRRRQG